MSIIIRQTEKQLQASLDLHSHAELVALRLSACKIESVDLSPGLESDQLSFAVKFGCTGAEFESGNKRLVLSYGFVLDGRQQGAEDSALKIECSFVADYLLQLNRKPSQPRIRAFADGNGIMNLWPFAREFFQSALQRMGFPQPPLPFLRLAVDSVARPRAGKRQAKKTGKSTSKPSRSTGS